MRGIMDGKKGALINYNEFIKKLNIPKEYLLYVILGGNPLVSVYLTKIEEIKIGKIVPNIHHITKTDSVLFITKDEFNKKLGLKYDDFDANVYFKEKTTFLRIGSFSEELKYYLEKDSEQVYLWISEEGADKRRKLSFMETK